jgi:hypothetical protein
MRLIWSDPDHQLRRMPRSIQCDRRVGAPGLQPSSYRIILGCLAVLPGLVYCYEQVVLGPANHSYAGPLMRMKQCATVRFRYPRYPSVVIGSGSPSWLGSRNRLMTSWNDEVMIRYI